MTELGTDEAADTEAGNLSPEDVAFSRSVGARLRAVRRAQGMSLAEVEERSSGKWSSSAIGAYERGFRNLSVPRLRALADFYQVPMGVLLGEPSAQAATTERGKLVLDLEALRRVAAGQPVMRFVESIVVARGDYNGRILSLRHDDLQRAQRPGRRRHRQRHGAAARLGRAHRGPRPPRPRLPHRPPVD